MENEVYLLWTNPDQEVFRMVVKSYALSAINKGWWQKATLILWGPTVKMAVQEEKIKEAAKEIMENGVIVSACITCANEYGIVGELEEMGVELAGWSEKITKLLKSNQRIIYI